MSVGEEKRTYNGIIADFKQTNTPFTPLNAWTTYHAVLVPKLWLLTTGGQCRIFQNKTTLNIIESVLGEAEIKMLTT